MAWSNNTGRKITDGRPARQQWQIGEVVNVGFLKNLMVIRKEATPGDYAPDAWHLVSRDGKHYRFVPHRGIERMEVA
jgi:hypothetical protein